MIAFAMPPWFVRLFQGGKPTNPTPTQPLPEPSLIERLAILEVSHTNLRAQFNESQADLAQARREAREARQYIEMLQGTLTEQSRYAQSLAQSFGGLQRENAELRELHRQDAETIDTLKERLTRTEERVEALTDQLAIERNKALASLLARDEAIRQRDQAEQRTRQLVSFIEANNLLVPEDRRSEPRP